MTTPHTAEALALQLDDYARGDEYQRCTEDAATLIRSQAAEIERLRSALAGVMPMVENWVDCGHDFNECANVRIRDAARAALEVPHAADK